MTRLADPRLRSFFVVLLWAVSSSASASAAQLDAPLTCTMTGGVSSAGMSLPGVVVSVKAADRLVASTSTGEGGRWLAVVAPGTYRLVFELRGFTTLERDHVADTAHCADDIETTLTVSSTVPVDTSGATPSIRLPALAASRPGLVLVPGRAASINRALLRERAAAIARGDIVPTDQSRTQGLVNGSAFDSEGSQTLPPIAARTPSGGADAARAPLVAQRLPQASVIAGSRLYSATSSYTVAGSALDSAPYQLRADAKQPKPDYLRQSVDFTVGGPLAIPGTLGGLLKTNATLSYSAIRGGNVFDQYATVPTADMRMGDFSSLSAYPRDPLTGRPFVNGIVPTDRISESARALLTYIPLPNASGTSRNFHYTSTNRSTQDSLNLRLTRPIAGSSTPAARGGRTGRTAPGSSSSGLSATVNGQLEYRRNVNDRLNAIPAIAGVGRSTNLRVPVSLNVSRRGTQHSLSLGYTRNTNDTTNRYAGVLDVADSAGIRGASQDPFAWGIPALSFATLTNVSDLTPSSRTDQRLTFGYSWSRGIGTHRMRVGADFGESRSRNRTDQSARGAFVFTGLYTGSDIADFLLGQPQQAAVQYGPGVVNLAGRSLSVYAQDDWRRWSRVTVNAGVRYELVTPFRDVAGGLANLDAAPGFVAVAPVTSGATGPYSGRFPDALVRTDTNNVAPRVGIAWRFAARTTLRAGYGVSFNTGSYATIARQLASQPPFAVTNTVIGSVTEPLSLSSALAAAASDTANTYGVTRNYDAGVVGTWTLDLSRDMGDAWNLSGGVTRATGSNLDIVRAPNRGPGGLLLANVQPFLWQTSEGRSQLRSATLRLRRSYVRGVSTSINYTYARSMDNASTIGGGTTVVAQDEQNLAAEWGTSSFNRGHQLSGDLNFELPFGEGHRWFNRGGPWTTLLGRWSAYITFAAQSGTPLTARVLSSATDVARGINGTLRADVTGEPVALAQPSADRFFNTSAFRLPQAGVFGNAGRNTITGPGSRDLSVQVTRDVPLGGTRTVSVQLRVTNVLNLVNYAAVDAVVNSPTFGQVLSVRPLRSAQLNVRWRF